MLTIKEIASVLARKPQEIQNKQMNQTVIEPTKGWSALKLYELWEFRDLLYYLAWRDLTGRYRQMALGPLWIILQPLLSMVLYTVVFGTIAKLPSENQPYAVFTYVALLPWTFFSNTLNSAANSLLGSKDLIKKVYFPRLVVPISRVLSHLVDFGISFIILFGMLAFYGIKPTWGVVLIPLFLLLAAVAGIGTGLWFAGMIVHYRDMAQVVSYLVRFLMYSAPVVYSMELIPEQWRTLYQLNPVTGIVEGFRWALLGTGNPPSWTLLFQVLLSVSVFIGGLYIFRRVERNIVDIA